MSQAIRFHNTGGPEVLRLEQVEVPPPGPGEVTVRHAAAGVNFIDIYYREGTYPTALPSGLGQEGAGTVVAIGPGVSGLREGHRVAYVSPSLGAYAEQRNVPADLLLPLPDGIAFATAAAMMLRGLTAQYLLRRTCRVAAGDLIVVHAAAGGVGLILCQWASALGARVVGIVGSAEKVALARRHGCSHVLLAGDDVVARVREIGGGEGAAVVYDAVGKDTFIQSLDCLRPLGTMVSFGNASGLVPPVDLRELSKRGSLFLTRPTLFTYTRKREDLLQMADELFGMVGSGAVRIEIGQTYPLQEAARAHADLAARRTVGSTVLTL
ncbi:MAG: quinone oxidoreductase [Rhodocyclaceae bacterium]|nr:quinone oxidoreductase [Rhodocyclaceae bacterium]